MNSILSEFDFQIPKFVIKDLDSIPNQIMIKRRKRRDFRKVTTLTIDPVDAKDFDDALSFKELDDEITIGVHIADVGHL